MTHSSIYLVTNKVNGKQYVGITSRTIQERWNVHCCHAKQQFYKSALHAAIRKYGEDAFDVTLVEHNDYYATDREIHFIEHYNTFNEGYNLTTGGEGMPGFKHDKETKEKIRQTHLGRTFTEEHKEKLSQAKRGKKRPPLTEERKEKIRQSLLGRTFSEESKEKMRRGSQIRNYHTPHGVFPTIVLAAKACGCGRSAIYQRFKNPDFPDYYWTNIND